MAKSNKPKGGKSLLKDKFSYLYKSLIDQKPTLPVDSNAQCGWRCPKNPKHIWTETVKSRVASRNNPNCPYCKNKLAIPGAPKTKGGVKPKPQAAAPQAAPKPQPESEKPRFASNKFANGIEEQVYNALRLLTPELKLHHNVKTDIGEVDFVLELPDHSRTQYKNLAIEFNGVKHHDLQTKGPDHLSRKYDRLRQAGFLPFTIWSDEWFSLPRRQAVLIEYAQLLYDLKIVDTRQLASNLRRAFNAERLDINREPIAPTSAFNMAVIEVSTMEAQVFMAEHSAAKIVDTADGFYGLLYNNQIYAVFGLNEHPLYHQIVHYAANCVVPDLLQRIAAYAKDQHAHSQGYGIVTITVDNDRLNEAALTKAGFQLKDTFMPKAVVYTMQHYDGTEVTEADGDKPEKCRGERHPDILVTANNQHLVYNSGYTRWESTNL